MDNLQSFANQAMTPRTLAESNKLLNIPIYQRLFVWEEEQIELLLKDLLECTGTNKPYYIGIITVVEKKDICDIVDGQQRLTFLSLFAAYVCAHAELYPQRVDAWRKFLFVENELRINYTGRSEDREEIKKLAENSKAFININNRNFRIFNECMIRLEERFTSEFIDYFIDYVYKYASFLVSVLPDNFEASDLNLFFEKMNSAGRQLTAVEEIKGKFFPARAAEFDACLNFENRFEDVSQNGDTIKETILNVLDMNQDEPSNNNDKTSSEGYSSVLSPEIFLLHSLQIAIGIENSGKILHDERKLLGQFKDWVESGSEKKISPDALLEIMKKYRKFLDDNIIFLKIAWNGSTEYCFRKEDEESERESLSTDVKDNDIKKLRIMMKQFQSMLYVSSSNWQQWVLDAYLYQTTKHEMNLDILKTQDLKRHTLPKLDSMKYNSIDRYWFWKLDYLLWEKMQDDVNYFDSYKLSDREKNAIETYRFKRNRSIEHLHPQTDGNIEEWKEEKHQFGNLAMISSSFNSTQQNDSIGVKFERLNDTQIPQKSLESIKMLLMFAIAGRQESGWTPKKAEEHGGAMHKLLSDYYELRVS